MDQLPRLLIIAGLLLLVLGLLLQVLPSLPLLGRLPGDIRIERPGFRFYFPFTSCAILSLALSGALWLISKWR